MKLNYNIGIVKNTLKITKRKAQGSTCFYCTISSDQFETLLLPLTKRLLPWLQVNDSNAYTKITMS